MELNKLKTLHILLKDFKEVYEEDYTRNMTFNSLLLEVDELIKLEEYKMMLKYMDQQATRHSNGHPTDMDFDNSNFTISFGLKTIQVGNSEVVFDRIREMLLNEIDTIERGY